MLTRQTIEEYHAREGLPQADHKIGIELELFCIDTTTSKPLPYQNDEGKLSVQTLFTYLETHEGYEVVGTSKTFELKKGGTKVSLEPGAQIEFCSTPSASPEALLEELWAYFAVLKRLSQVFAVSWLDISYFPVGNADDIPLLPSPRCEIIDRYWQHTGKLGRDLMRYTTSLHVSFDYDDVSDLTSKVERLLFLKPILLFLTASSRIAHGRDTGVRSFRTTIYTDTDAARTGTPGSDALWQSGQWTLEGYIEKVLQAPSIFTVSAPGTYRESEHEPFAHYLQGASFADYLSHLATIYTDIRVRQYIEVRYLDNPGIRLLPGMIILLYRLLYDDAAWRTFSPALPYAFHEIPAIVDLLNSVSAAADDYWETRLLEPVKVLLLSLQKRVQPELAEHLDSLLDRTIHYKRRDLLPDLSSDASILAYFQNAFPF
jgi:glutamate--cysteine ligase